MAATKYDCIVLDLDGTLVFSDEKKTTDSKEISFVDAHGDKVKMWVHERPGLQDFLQKCFDHMVVGVWSMGQAGYVEAITSLFPQRPEFVFNWRDCDRKEGRIYKKLQNIPYYGNVVMVDDNDSVLERCTRVDVRIVPPFNPCNDDDNTLHEMESWLFGEE